jgi:hypothetical protein
MLVLEIIRVVEPRWRIGTSSNWVQQGNYRVSCYVVVLPSSTKSLILCVLVRNAPDQETGLWEENHGFLIKVSK